MSFWKTVAVEGISRNVSMVAEFAGYLSTLLFFAEDFGGYEDFLRVFMVLDGSLLEQ